MKMKKKHSLVFLAGQYIVHLFTDKLPRELLFHNFHHTANVVRGVRHICKHSRLLKEEKELLLLAAWFHDSGFISAYAGHEEVSKKLAREFLEKHQYPEDRLELVLSCIGATKMPQQPQGVLQEIICDADMFHLSLPEYYYLQKLLLEEWKLMRHKKSTDVEWLEENLTFLTEHRYFTTYGQVELQRGKEWNIAQCRALLEDALRREKNS